MIETTVKGLIEIVPRGQTLYIASPYTHADPMVREMRFRAVVDVALYWSLQGLPVFSPIIHSHTMLTLGGRDDIAVDWAMWRNIDLPLVRDFGGLVVFKLDGWLESVGMTEEIDFARQLGKPMYGVQIGGDHATA